jgi:glycosyltransferase involved in cell wall biosynthesis
MFWTKLNSSANKRKSPIISAFPTFRFCRPKLESFGLAALEAQACEVPVVASRVGGIPEVINDGETGFMSDIGDTEKMSDDVLLLLNDEETRLSFGKRGRELPFRVTVPRKSFRSIFNFTKRFCRRKRKNINHFFITDAHG